MVNYGFLGFIALLTFAGFIFMAYYYPSALGLTPKAVPSNTIDPKDKSIYWRGD